MADYSAQISRIRQAQSLDEIRDVARQFSAQAMGDGGVLYSRPVGGVTSEVIALELAKKGGLPVINETPRAIFLSDLQVKQAVDSSAARILKAQGVSPAALEALTLDFQYGNPKAVANSLTSLEGCLWGDASREFAASMRGDIKVVATAANMERVFGKVELPTILDNPNVQTLGGKSLADLRAIAAAEGTQALLDPVQAQFVEAAPRGIFKSAGALSITTEPVALSREFADAMGIDSNRFSPAAELSTSGTVVRADIGMAVQVAQDEVRIMRASTAPEHVPTQRLRPSGAAATEVPPGLAAAEGIAPRPAGNPGIRAAGIAGTALLAYDFGTSGHQWVQLQSQGNQAGADSTATRFVGRNVGGAMGGFLAGAGAGALTGSWSGPGALVAGLGGGVVGAYMGDRWAEQKDIDRVYTQIDPGGRTWTRDPQDPQGRWVRGAHQQQVQTSALAGEVEVKPVQTSLGEDVLFRADYVATGRLERLLNHKAANASYEIGLANPPLPKDPFRQDASAEQQPARTPFETERAFVRDPQSGQWQLEIKQMLDGRIPNTRLDAVSAERGLELDQQSRTVIAQNAANSPTAMASRYRVAYEQGRWSDFDPALPPAINNELLKTDTLQASDGNSYTRRADGQWLSDGVLYNSSADLNLRDELELTLQSLQVGVQEMNAMADYTRANPQLEPEGVRGQLATLYAKHGIERSAAQLDASVAAVERNHVRDGLNQDFTLELMPDPRTRAPSADSAIATFSDGGGNRMVLKSTTTAEDITQTQLNAVDQQQARLPGSPELRIATLPLQEREAHQPTLRQADRQGASSLGDLQDAPTATPEEQLVTGLIDNPGGRATHAGHPASTPPVPSARQETDVPLLTTPHSTEQHAPDPSPERGDGLLKSSWESTVPPDRQSTPMQAGHPDHRLYEQVRHGVAALDAEHGRSFDATSERMTASLLVLAKSNGLERVDHVLLSNPTAALPAAHIVFVVQGEPSSHMRQSAAMPTAQAAQTSVEESMQKLNVLSQDQQQRGQEQQLEQQSHIARS